MPGAESAGAAAVWLFGGDRPADPLLWHQVCARTLLVYLGGVAIVRLGKSRLIGRITSVDVLVGFVLGSLLSRGMTGSASITHTLASCATLVAAHWALTRWAVTSHRVGGWIKGHHRVLVEDGRPLPDALRRSNLSMEDLEEALRLQGVDDLREVRRATKERNGEVSVLWGRGGAR